MADSILLKDLLVLTKDGEWGKGEPASDKVEMLVIRGADFPAVRYGDLSQVPIRYIPEKIAGRKCLGANDILIETAGGTKGRPTGRTVFLKPRLFKQGKRPITCASFSRFLRVNTDIAEPEYIFWYLQFLYETGQMDQHQVQHTGIARFQYTKFAESLDIPLPPLPEQRAIAHILGTLDDKIELNQQMNRTLEAIARAIFKSWFVDFDPVRAKMEGRQPVGMDAATADLFPDEFEDSPLGKIPKGWGVSTIGESVKVVGGSTPSTKKPEYWKDGIIHWATPKDLAPLQSPVLLDTERKITELGLQKISSGLLPKGTLLLSSRAPIGYLAISEVPVAINQGFIAMICNHRLPSHYVLHWTQQNLDVIKGRANGTTFLEISKSNFRPIEIVIPEYKILQIFTFKAKCLHHNVINNIQQSRTLAAIRDTLLPKLLSGEIRVKAAEKVLEEVT